MSPKRPDIEEALRILRRMDADLDGQELDATRSERAYLAGATQALEWVLGTRPEPPQVGS